ncbi:MAG: ABC-type transport auxiliary lipoprotein family protein [Terrimicrobiaceae bacterium]|nr:ABC-type transport auxiliary lipoprotein family protein [Terrimicrobiaceae bacterium]
MTRAAPLSLALLVAMLAACSSFCPRPKPEYFALDPGKPASLRALRPANSSATASVGFVDVAAPFASDGFVYQLSAGRWEVDPYNQFLVSPADMMTSILRNWTRESGLYGEVAEPGAGGGQDISIDCNLTALYGDFRNPTAPQAVLTMEVQVFRRTDKGSVIALRRMFTQSVPVASRTPAALVAAWNEALRVELNELLRALGQLHG